MKYSADDIKQREALLDGASALEYRASKLAGLLNFWHSGETDRKTTEAWDKVNQFRKNAEILKKMAR